jgi:hypothetical protein
MGSVVFIFLAFCVVVFGEVRVAHLFSFLCCILCFVCLRSVYYVPNVANFSVLSILDCRSSFL